MLYECEVNTDIWNALGKHINLLISCKHIILGYGVDIIQEQFIHIKLTHIVDVIFMGNYCLPFHFSYIIMHLKILFLFYYLVVPPIVHSYYIKIILVSLRV